jgi:hypothetical protein
MTIQEALNTAVTGGYHVVGSDGAATSYSGANDEYSTWTRTDNQSSFLVPVYETFLDPAFWHALGRALGWDAPCEIAITCVHEAHECWRWYGSYWMYHWHCFIQQLARGDTPDAFFARLPHSMQQEQRQIDRETALSRARMRMAIARAASETACINRWYVQSLCISRRSVPPRISHGYNAAEPAAGLKGDCVARSHLR